MSMRPSIINTGSLGGYIIAFVSNVRMILHMDRRNINTNHNLTSIWTQYIVLTRVISSVIQCLMIYCIQN